ncbi:XRE family transcriptional regulator [Billgrantia gudaonensis]|uniref:Phage repressor protein C, contains Cro/C1-type HTH and peptisase s24 domains n=1 Tax=Billgrantia gudaonensis TaxID=376427 RepID=A0A1G8XDP4_9GAMM|nr:LexA family transcriptional regulator [Halomonas gudaonensis]SDJ88749.1 Phage repressor protein C, contains Cro/C1-type HTH and peptisase s24 domains [Halomonas gudaonensis]
MSNLGERLRQERIRLGMSQEEFGAVGGVKKVAQSNYETGKRFPDSQYMERLAASGVDIQFVVSGIHSGNSQTAAPPAAYRVDSSEPAETHSLDPGPDYAAVAMYDIEAAAGAGRSFEGEPVQSVLYIHHGELETLGLPPGQVVGVKARGDSMEPTLADGDWVLVDRASRDVRQEGVFLLLVSGERRIKRVQRLAGGALYLISDNTHYQPEMIPPERMGEVEILGRCEVRLGRIA